jgi:holo-[acyl-carrier protein] synthase
MLTSLGIDIVEISRFRDALARRPGLAARLFTAREREYCERRADPAPHYAARFAAKEAAAKAAGRYLRWQEVEVVSGPSGAPALSITGQSARWAEVTRGARFLVSLSHSREHAVAVVALLSPEQGPPEDESDQGVAA